MDRSPGSTRGERAWTAGRAPTPHAREGTASLYDYFGATAVIFLLMLRLPPNGPPDWLEPRRGD